MIEDDAMLADLLARALRKTFDAAHLSVFATGREGVEHCPAQPPDLLLVDLGLPDMNGRQIIRTLGEKLPSLRVIVLTGESSPRLPGELLALGASGFVDKMSSFDEVENAVRRVLDNGLYFSAGMKPSPPSRGARDTPPSGPPPSVLSEREREIARFVTDGLISKEIADRLGLSPRTVEKARAQILAKLGLRDLPSLVRWSLQHGLS